MAYPFSLPELGYDYDALEPHIDARTMEIHHSKHHAGYTNKLNAALEGHPELHGYSGEQLLMALDALPDDIRTAVRNNGGGFVNHALFWDVMRPGGASAPAGELASAIDQAFGSFDAFKERFTAAAGSRFGSGWGWLVVDPFGNLAVTSTANQDNPLTQGSTPILGVDVWEHAYYLHYQNRRPDYLAAWWNVVNWDVVGARYAEARGGWIHSLG
ncbi:MAG: superoxide dismutase [Gemmatimonadetes bacterium]|nr:MAG: superoxide dismutase [Gemmatimonadota bacterium]